MQKFGTIIGKFQNQECWNKEQAQHDPWTSKKKILASQVRFMVLLPQVIPDVWDKVIFGEQQWVSLLTGHNVILIGSGGLLKRWVRRSLSTTSSDIQICASHPQR